MVVEAEKPDQGEPRVSVLVERQEKTHVSLQGHPCKDKNKTKQKNSYSNLLFYLGLQ